MTSQPDLQFLVMKTVIKCSSITFLECLWFACIYCPFHYLILGEQERGCWEHYVNLKKTFLTEVRIP